MKLLLVSTIVVAVISLAMSWRLGGELERLAAQSEPAGGEFSGTPAENGNPVFGITDALIEDTWVNAIRTAGSDLRTLTDASSSMCYLTKIEISGVQSPDDSNSCAIAVDDFTGFWQLIATVDEGGRSEVRCNARCLTWDSNGTE